MLHIKRRIKLNINEATTNRGKDGYKPSHKFDFIWRTLVHNVNAFTNQACLDLTGDEKIWGNQGWRERQSGMARKITNMPGVCKEGQVVLVYGVDRIRPSTYLHRHKLWEIPAGFTLEGTNEVRMVL